MNSGPDHGAAGDDEHRPPDEHAPPDERVPASDDQHGMADDDPEIDWEQRVAEASAEVDEESAQAGGQSKFDAWRRRSAAGAIMTGIARGLQQVFEKEREEPSIVQETSGDPPTDLPVEADVQQGRARHSVVNIRPWLLRRPGGAGEPEEPLPPDEAHDRPGDGEGSAGEDN